MNIVPNMTGKGLGPGTAAKYFLLLCDVFSNFAALFPMKEKTPSSVFTAITTWQTIYKTAEAEIHPGFFSSIRSDADPVFMSEELHNACTNRGIALTHASPRHQEMNGLTERTWQKIREIAFSMMVHAHVGDEFYEFSLDHAWKIFNCLPIRGLELDGRPTTPFEMFYGVKTCLERFKVLFCSIVVNIGPKIGTDGRVRHRRNNPERGVAGIHVGIPKNSDGWLCYIPSMNNTVIFSDVTFDENFESTHV